MPMLTNSDFLTRLSYMQVHRKAVLAISALALVVTAACSDNDDDFFEPGVGPTSDSVRFEFRTFNQVERLGNPLVAEVLLEMKDHGFHDVGTPNTDRQNFKAKVVAFITGVAKRSPATANALADVLLPDMLVLQTDKAAGTAGYLGYVLNPNAYGGRRLQDDVVDTSLMAVFGPLVDPNNVSPGLTTDNVPAFGGGPVPTATFPYLAPPNQ